MATMNRTAAEWDRKMRELKRKEMLWKQQARERGEETGSDDDDEEGFDNVEWDVLEGSGSPAVPHELRGAGGSATVPEVPTERGGSVAMPSEAREMSPFAQEQGVGSKRSRLDELEQESGGSSPKCSYRPIT